MTTYRIPWKVLDCRPKGRRESDRNQRVGKVISSEAEIGIGQMTLNL